MVQNLPNNNQTTNLSQLLSLLKRDPMRPIWLTFTWARILYLKDVQMSMGRWLDKRGLGEISRFWNFDYTALGIWDSLSWVNFRLKWAQRQRKSKLTLGLNSVHNPYHQQHSMEEHLEDFLRWRSRSIGPSGSMQWRVDEMLLQNKYLANQQLCFK